MRTSAPYLAGRLRPRPASRPARQPAVEPGDLAAERAGEHGAALHGEMRVLTPEGGSCSEAEGLTLRKASPEALRTATGTRLESWLYEVEMAAAPPRRLGVGAGRCSRRAVVDLRGSTRRRRRARGGAPAPRRAMPGRPGARRSRRAPVRSRGSRTWSARWSRIRPTVRSAAWCTSGASTRLPRASSPPRRSPPPGAVLRRRPSRGADARAREPVHARLARHAGDAAGRARRADRARRRADLGASAAPSPSSIPRCGVG